MRLPHPILFRLLLRRGILLWIGTRLVLWIGARFIEMMGLRTAAAAATWRLDALHVPWFLALLAAVVWIDLRRRRELTLISDLGVAPVFASMLACVPALAGEIAITTALS